MSFGRRAGRGPYPRLASWKGQGVGRGRCGVAGGEAGHLVWGSEVVAAGKHLGAAFGASAEAGADKAHLAGMGALSAKATPE